MVLKVTFFFTVWLMLVIHKIKFVMIFSQIETQDLVQSLKKFGFFMCEERTTYDTVLFFRKDWRDIRCTVNDFFREHFTLRISDFPVIS